MEGFVVGLVLIAAVIALVLWSRAQAQKKREYAAAYAVAAAAEAAATKAAATPAASPTPNNSPTPNKKKKNKKQKKGSATKAVVDEEALALGRGVVETQEPRAQHYLFGHRLFRDTMRSPDIVRGVMALADNAANHAVEKLWEGAAKVAMASDGKRAIIPGGPPKVQLLADGLLVRMPPPVGTTECLFILVLIDGDEVRYFTLEKAPPILSKNPYTVCEWKKELHLNMGNDAVPDPTEEAFIAFARGRLSSVS